jgi:hypothetical protein
VPRAFSVGISAATAGSGTGQSARPSGVAHRSSHASTAVAGICASRPLVGYAPAAFIDEVKMHEAAMVCSGGIAISPGGGTSITIDIPFADAVLFG